jgi:hypothetical protein
MGAVRCERGEDFLCSLQEKDPTAILRMRLHNLLLILFVNYSLLLTIIIAKAPGVALEVHPLSPCPLPTPRLPRTNNG